MFCEEKHVSFREIEMLGISGSVFVEGGVPLWANILEYNADSAVLVGNEVVSERLVFPGVGGQTVQSALLLLNGLSIVIGSSIG